MKQTITSTVRPMNKGGRRTDQSKAAVFFETLKSAAKHRRPAVREFCASYGVTQEMFTRLTGFSPRAVAHWAQGRKPSASTERRLRELDRIFEALGKIVHKQAIGPWLRRPNSAFDGSTPLQVIERGEIDRIWRMIYELQSGEPG